MKGFQQTTVGLIALIVAVVSINVIASRFYGRLDVTEEKLFTLSEGTRNLVSNLEKTVDLRLYYSRSIKELPPTFKNYANRVEEILKQYRAMSGGKIRISVIDPKPDTDDEEWARKYGIQALPLGVGEEVYFGLVALSGKEETVLPFLDPRRESFFEYELSEAIFRTTQESKLKISLISGLAIQGTPPRGLPGQPPMPGGESWAFLQELSQRAEVQSVAADAAEVAEDTDVLVVFHPKNLSENNLYAIDQHIVKGGRAVIAVDPFSRADLMASGGGGNPFGGAQNNSDLKRLFTTWQVDYQPQQLVGDLKQAAQLRGGFSYPYFISLAEQGVSRSSVITAQLNNLTFAEPGAFSVKEDAVLNWEALIETSDAAGTANAMMARMMQPDEFARQLKTDGKQRTLVGMLTGRFPSSFDKAPDGVEAQHVGQAEAESSVLLIADVDFLQDNNTVQKFSFGGQTIIQPLNDNIALFVNGVEMLGGSQDLIGIRSKGVVARPFTKVQELQQVAHKRWKKVEEELSAKIDDLQSKLRELQQKRSDSSTLFLSADQQRELERFRDEEQQFRRQRREVRKNLREDIEVLGARLLAANLLIIPMGVGAFGVAMFMRRNRRRRMGDK